MLTVGVIGLNEEKNIEGTVEKIVWSLHAARISEYEIIIVDDGSKDRMYEVSCSLKNKYEHISVIRHEKNLGVGASILSAAKNGKHERFTVFAGDNNSTRHLMVNLFSHYLDADLIVTYILNTEYRSRFRTILSTIFSTVYTVSFDLHIKYINGNTVYPRQKLLACLPKSRGYSMLAEAAVKLLRQGCTFKEVEGYLNQEILKSFALRGSVLLEVILTYFRLLIEVYIINKDKYSKKSYRIQPSLPAMEP